MATGALEGKVAVITGSTSGIGARTAELFVAEGARVVIAGRRAENGKRFARTLGAAARFIRTDVSVESDVEAMIAHAVTSFGRLDCLVNNAGSGSQRGGIAEIDLQRFDVEFGVHVRGPLAAMKHAVPVMVAQGAGSIINVASVNGTRAGLGGIAYSAAKAALVHLTRCAAVELGEKGIRVNSLSPGPIATGISPRAPASSMTKRTSVSTTRRGRLPPCCRDGSRCPTSGRSTISPMSRCFWRAMLRGS